MVNNTAMAQELGYMHIPEGTLISIDEINQYPPEQVVLVTTGSQGEPLSALSRMASCSHRQVRVGPGDFIIISAKPIPGNEKSVTKIVNGLLLLGAEVIYEGKMCIRDRCLRVGRPAHRELCGQLQSDLFPHPGGGDRRLHGHQGTI